MLLLKIFLVPFFLAVISLAGKRMGPSFAGWLAGLPVVVGPILFLLALEQGAPFAAASAVFTLATVSTVIAFGLGYAWAARSAGWGLAFLAGLTAWLIAACVVGAISFTLTSAAAAALAAILIGPHLFPPLANITARAPLPWSELLLRMLAGGLLTFLVTHFSQHLGTTWAGIAALAPVLTPVLAVFVHRRSGGDHAIALLKGLVRGLAALAAFCAVVASQLASLGISTTFALAILVALCVQGLTYYLGSRSR